MKGLLFLLLHETITEKTYLHDLHVALFIVNINGKLQSIYFTILIVNFENV
jgi:hypothetical protein